MSKSDICIWSLFLLLVLRVDSQEGETKNLSWMEAFFPRSWEYNIFHFYDSSNKTVIQVRGDGATSINAEKYVYHSRPFNSTNVVFEVKNITLMDAGYYGGGTTQINARRGQGVILVVRGKTTSLNFIVHVYWLEIKSYSLSKFVWMCKSEIIMMYMKSIRCSNTLCVK